jgi:undecaprenyl-diphosphatase
MEMWIVTAVVLGLVQGLTEFIPVSSTAHLILVGDLMHFTGARAATFEVFIQLGSVLAVVAVYWRRFFELLNFRRTSGFAGPRGLGFLFLTTLPALVLGAVFHDAIKTYLFNPFNVAIGMAVGGAWILLAERFFTGAAKNNLDGLTWKDALWIGCFQCMAMWPGMSRSASTILGGMITGLERKTATEYSFFAAVPVMFAATLFDLWKSLPCLSRTDIPFFGLGFIVSFFSAWLAIRFLIRFVGRHTLVPFGWYRLAVAVVVFWLLA